MTASYPPAPSVGLLWRGDAAEPRPEPNETRFHAIFDAFEAAGLRAEPVVYDEAVAADVRQQLLSLEAVLVWVDPIVQGRDRALLDLLLEEVAERGVFVSAHPATIRAMGTKEVLHRTRQLPFGTDTHLYRTLDELIAGMPPSLRTGPRVLKQDRGSSGNGVWKLELLEDAADARDITVRVQPAERGLPVQDMHFSEFVEQRRPYLRYFAGRGTFVDQPFARRLDEGMVRAYMALDRVAGFGQQYVTALTPPASGAAMPPDPAPRVYFGPNASAFQPLRERLETSWIAMLLDAAGLSRDQLPVIWDADFLLGTRDADGKDTYLLCEINVSGVFPIPDEAAPALVEATIERLHAGAADHRL